MRNDCSVEKYWQSASKMLVSHVKKYILLHQRMQNISFLEFTETIFVHHQAECPSDLPLWNQKYSQCLSQSNLLRVREDGERRDFHRHAECVPTQFPNLLWNKFFFVSPNCAEDTASCGKQVTRVILQCFQRADRVLDGQTLIKLTRPDARILLQTVSVAGVTIQKVRSSLCCVFLPVWLNSRTFSPHLWG